MPLCMGFELASIQLHDALDYSAEGLSADKFEQVSLFSRLNIVPIITTPVGVVMVSYSSEEERLCKSYTMGLTT